MGILTGLKCAKCVMRAQFPKNNGGNSHALRFSSLVLCFVHCPRLFVFALAVHCGTIWLGSKTNSVSKITILLLCVLVIPHDAQNKVKIDSYSKLFRDTKLQVRCFFVFVEVLTYC